MLAAGLLPARGKDAAAEAGLEAERAGAAAHRGSYAVYPRTIESAAARFGLVADALVKAQSRSKFVH